MLELDPKELSRRRQLANARRERDSARRDLLIRLIRARQRAGLLRGWISAYEGTAESNSPLERMVAWSRPQLDELDAFTDPARLSALLVDRNLFPEPDKLIDPLGEPPPLRP
jgi:hypothetical protein